MNLGPCYPAVCSDISDSGAWVYLKDVDVK